MTTTVGLSMIGLGPPGSQAPGQTARSEMPDFASYLDAASRSTEARDRLGNERVEAVRGLEASDASADDVEETDDTAGVGAQARTSGQAAQTESEAPPGGDAVDGPDRTSEAQTETSTAETDAPSPLAMSLGLVVPVALAPPAPAVAAVEAAAGGTPAIEAVDAATDDVVGSSATISGQGTATEPEARGDLDFGTNTVSGGAADAPARPGESVQPEAVATPADQLGATVTDLPVDERRAMASAWNGAGGRIPTTDKPSDGAPATEAHDVPLTTSDATARDLTTDAAMPAETRGDVGRRVGRRLEGTTADGTESTTQQVHASYGPGAEPVRAPDGTAGVATAAPTLDAADTADVATMARQLGNTVVEAVRSGTETLRLVLNPPELGHLDIRVQQTDGGLRVHLATATAEARDALERALPALVSGLEARSLRVEHAEVRHASGTDAGRWTDQGSNARQRGDGNDRQAWERPDWSEAAALNPPGERNRVQGVEQLLDVVA